MRRMVEHSVRKLKISVIFSNITFIDFILCNFGIKFLRFRLRFSNASNGVVYTLVLQVNWIRNFLQTTKDGLKDQGRQEVPIFCGKELRFVVSSERLATLLRLVTYTLMGRVLTRVTCPSVTRFYCTVSLRQKKFSFVR